MLILLPGIIRSCDEIHLIYIKHIDFHIIALDTAAVASGSHGIVILDVLQQEL